MAVAGNIKEPELVWLGVRRPPFRLYGFFDARNQPVFRRIPEEIARAVSPALISLHTNTAGGRLRFRTDSPYVAIRAEMPGACHMAHMPLTGSAGFDLYAYKKRHHRYAGTFTPPPDMTEGYEALINTGPGAMRDYLINFPLYSDVTDLYIGLHRDYRVEEGAPYANDKPVVFYGSSITQGGCASRPGNSYQNFISRQLDMDYLNLGFSGNGKAEPAIATYMADLVMQAFVCDYDHNAPTTDYLLATHKPLYETIRRRQPDLPYLILSRPDFDSNPEESRKRREIIYATYRDAVEGGDDRVYFIDGERLFGTHERGSCTVDGCHPNDLGFYRMAQVIAGVLARLW
ncbi:MAG: SGNH/GDSL hydrolase family protein [Treponema sp.]|nr:SGNH/GDSL hydrolase family protein [Treponema sp.]